MKKLKTRKYRIVKVSDGYIVEIWRIWFPFWQIAGGWRGNWHPSPQGAIDYIRNKGYRKYINIEWH